MTGVSSPLLVVPPVNGPVRQGLLQAVYDAMNATLQPAYVKNDNGVTPDGAFLNTALVSITSTSFVEISPLLTTVFTHNVSKIVGVHLPIYVNITTLSTVAEIGINVNGVLDTASLLRVASTAASGCNTQFNGSFFFPLLYFASSQSDGTYGDIPSGSFTIMPVARIVSGAAPNMNIRFGRTMRVIVKDI